MRSPSQLSRFRFFSSLVLIAFASAPLSSAAQTGAPAKGSHGQAGAGPAAVRAAMLSDIHFDPFHDPGKIKELAAAPASQWDSILASQPSADQQKAFASLQKTCGARGVDTPYALLQSSLKEVRSLEPQPQFMTVSGDLLAHDFPCRFQTLLPGAKPGDYQVFALKALAYLASALRASLPGKPVYLALGNNDSGCGDYRLDAGGEFLVQAGKILAEGLPHSQQEQAAKEIGETGSYSLAMDEPMRGTRLIVIDDTFLSPRFASCGGTPSATAGSAQIAWMKSQLDAARAARERVWVMGHIPPGVDVYSTIRKMQNICGQAKPETFLTSDAMADLLAEYGDVIRLAVFAHTHMDEMRYLPGPSADGPGVAVKMVPSISPVNGNLPALTVANVSPATATLQDYEVIAASDDNGAAWATEYRYRSVYGQPDFSAGSVKKLIAGFQNDSSAGQKSSQTYLHDFFVGDRSMLLTPFWPEYVCGMANISAKSFASCVCSSKK